MIAFNNNYSLDSVNNHHSNDGSMVTDEVQVPLYGGRYSRNPHPNGVSPGPQFPQGANWFSSSNYYNNYPHTAHHHHHHHLHHPSQELVMQENGQTGAEHNTTSSWPSHNHSPGQLYQNFDWLPQLTSSGGRTHQVSSSCQLHHHAGSEYSAAEESDVSPSPISNRTVSPAYLQPVKNKNPYEWMKKNIALPADSVTGKTRTKDKYRVVYTDQQRLELEKEFHFAKYITIRRKTELASFLGLSERQVKIWFQNRRAKERKQAKKRQELQCKQEPITHERLNHLTVL